MKKASDRPSIELLRETFEYDKETGKLTRKYLRARNLKLDSGHRTLDGYSIVGIGDQHVMAHHVVWAMSYGEWPSKQVKHVNGDKTDNRLANLKLSEKSAPAQALTVDRLNRAMRYDRENGKFYWAEKRKGIRVGDEVGAIDVNGYRKTTLEGNWYYVHQLVWFIEHDGIWPQGMLDHINGNRSDNRIVNLRDVSNSRNSHNSDKVGNKNSTGYRGVARYMDKYIAQIMIDGERKAIGMFATAEEARDAYLKYKAEHFGAGETG